MAETIEAFVAKLRQEGVEAGREAAEKHLAKARQEADAILADARAQARKILSDAQAQAEASQAKARTDLELAARDITLRLRDSLSRAVRQVLAAGAREQLADPEFLGGLLREIVLEYVEADIAKKSSFRITVTPEMRERLAQWALTRLRQPELAGVSIDLKGTLAQDGFEYRAEGAGIEVTVDSVVEALSELVNPALREMLSHAMSQEQ
jgi:V/A-type H+-transporting ATPase subunit E